MKVIPASEAYVDAIAELFDRYRQFYECESDMSLSKQFIADRLSNHESTIFIAIDDGSVTRGFVQLYPSFCSIDAGKILILHDLFVDDSVRNQGIGKLLMDKATEYARETGAVRLDLLTDKTNYPGQALYGKLGYRKTNEEFFAYSLKV
jgi:ribosomal protein S18 acetylase RimI-like enzyme